MEEETSEDGYQIKGTPRGELRHDLEGYREKGEIIVL